MIRDGTFMIMTAQPGSFAPREVLFASTTACNLDCAHCAVERGAARLPVPTAVRFLRSCRAAGIERVGFTGGEPFLDTRFLFAVSKAAVRSGFLFGLVTTNARWFRSGTELRRTLERLLESGFDGSFAVSVDAFHGRSPRKPARFIKSAVELWRRPDVARVISVRGARDKETDAILEALAGALDARLVRVQGRRVIRNGGLFVPITTIDLAPVGRARSLVDAWGKTWFKEDFCRGPGQVLYVLPNGDVKPCCGYATDSPRLTIGNIHRDSAAALLVNASRNPFVRGVYREGLTGIRRRLAERGAVFPGASANPCSFCRHILTGIPRNDLESCL